ncbi:hypothetical protein [Pseudonocardia pini]|uniref:hypothetical protein n=1 Tax=Pseudonocardia pini TaxID=2758030 RepID=UPI0015F0E9A9|nr:hypothetical protein [Pseudonocardia pini]
MTRRTPAELGWDGPVRLSRMWEFVLNEGETVTFGQIVGARHVALMNTEPAVRAEATLLEVLLRRRFTECVGSIRNGFISARKLGGVAAVAGRDGGDDLHIVFDAENPDLMAAEAVCSEMTEHVRRVFAATGLADDRRRLIDVLYSTMTAVLSVAERLSAMEPRERSAATASMRESIERARERVMALVQRQARYVYFRGTLIGLGAALALVVGVGLLNAWLWSDIVSTSALVGSTAFGAVGAVVSVFQRISKGSLRLDFTAPSGQLRMLGALRPAVGAVFGAIVQFGLVSGLLGATGAQPPAAFGVFAVLGFAAGFSERFATDMVERAGQVLSAAGADQDGADVKPVGVSRNVRVRR